MKGWRTLLFNIVLALFGVLEAADWSALLGSDRAAWMIAGIAAINMALRLTTNTAVGRDS